MHHNFLLLLHMDITKDITKDLCHNNHVYGFV